MSTTKTVDSRGRIILGPEYAGRTVLVEYQEGQIVVTPAVVIPEREMWLYRNPQALASVQRGLDEARAGRLRPYPAFDEDAAWAGTVPEVAESDQEG